MNSWAKYRFLLLGALFATLSVGLYYLVQQLSGSLSWTHIILIWLILTALYVGFGTLCAKAHTHDLNRNQERLGQAVEERTYALNEALGQRNASYTELERAHQEWEQAFDAIDDMVFLHDRDGKILRVNRAYADRAGLSYDKIIGRPYWDVFPRQKHCIGDFDKHPGSTTESELKLPGGEVIRSRLYSIGGNDGAFRYALHILNDITERKEVEQKLRLLKQAVEHSSSSVVVTDLEGRIQFVNRRFEQVTGYTREEAYGKNPRILGSGETPAEIYASMWQRISVGGKWQGEFHNRKKNGELFWEAVAISPVRDDAGELIGYMAIKDDIDQQKMTSKALRRSQKMEALGQLTGGIAHDFNNLLGIIIGNLDFLKRQVIDNEKALLRVETASKATLRGSELTKQLLAFSSRQGLTREATDVNQVINDMKELLDRSLTPEIVLVLRLEEAIWITEIDPGELQDAILNLALNAKTAMPKGGQLTITTRNSILNESYVNYHDEFNSGSYVELVVEDSGCGMTEEVMDHAFEPFYSTRAMGGGTGLGLSMVYGFVQRAGGYARLESKVGRGSRVHLYLPRSSGSRIEHSDEIQSTPPPVKSAGESTILVVDDEVELRDLTVEYLREVGYATLTADNATEALAILTSDRKVDLLFSDILMPGGMNGYELAVEAQTLRPEMGILLTSGFADDSIIRDVRAKFSVNILKKPFLRERLIQQVGGILEKRPD